MARLDLQPAGAAPAGGVGRVERLDDHALVAARHRVVEHRARRVGVGRDHARDPQRLRHELLERREALGARAVDQVLAARVQHVEEQRREPARLRRRLAVTWNGSGRPSAAQRDRLAVEHDRIDRQRQRRRDHLRHARGDVVERAREDADLVAAPVDLDAHAVELELDRRRADPLQRGVEVVARRGEHRLHRPQQLERDRPQPRRALGERDRGDGPEVAAQHQRPLDVGLRQRRPPWPPRRSSRRPARPGRCRRAAARSGTAARPRSRARAARGRRRGAPSASRRRSAPPTRVNVVLDLRDGERRLGGGRRARRAARPSRRRSGAGSARPTATRRRPASRRARAGAAARPAARPCRRGPTWRGRRPTPRRARAAACDYGCRSSRPSIPPATVMT